MLLLTKQATVRPSGQKETVNWSPSQVSLVLNPPVNCVDQAIDLLTWKVIQSTQWISVAREVRCCVLTEGPSKLNNVLQKANPSQNNWAILMADVASVHKRFIAVAVFTQPTNLHPLESIELLVLVVCKSTSHPFKQSRETSVSIASLFNDEQFVNQLTQSTTESQLRSLFALQIHRVSCQSEVHQVTQLITPTPSNALEVAKLKVTHFLSSFKGGLTEYRGNLCTAFYSPVHFFKVVNSVTSLFFTTLSIAYAFGIIYHQNGLFTVKQSLAATGFGGLLYSLLTNQPFVTLMPSPTVAIWTTVMLHYCKSNNLDFEFTYCIACIWSSVFTGVFSIFGMSKYLSILTPAVQEVFTLVSIKLFTVLVVGAIFSSSSAYLTCFVILLTLASAGTMVALDSLHQSTIFNQITRDFISGNALIITLVIFSSIGEPSDTRLQDVPLMSSSGAATTVISPLDHLLTCIYGCVMGLLIIVEDAITNVKINKETGKENEETTGKSLFLVALINAILATLKLPILNGVLFISRVHLKSLTKWNIRSVNTHKSLVPVKVLETRFPCLLANLILCLAVFFLDCLLRKMNRHLIYTILLYCSYLVLHGNQLYFRLALIFCQPSKYPANELTRVVPFYKIHIFTIIQMVEVILLGLLAFNENVFCRTLFPLAFAGVLVIRHFMLNRLFNQAELALLDRWVAIDRQVLPRPRPLVAVASQQTHIFTHLPFLPCSPSRQHATRNMRVASRDHSLCHGPFFLVQCPLVLWILLMAPLAMELWSNNWQVIHLNGSFTGNEKWKKAKCIKEDWALVVSCVCLSFPSFDPLVWD